MTPLPAASSFWPLFTRLGDTEILLPAALALAAWLAARTRAHRFALWWLAGLAAAMALTTASKLAFIGWGLGWATLDFTGVSGHAMFAAAIYPLLARTAASTATARWQHAALLGGCALAGLIAVSRLQLDAHSLSEVLAGLALGGAAAAAALKRAHLPRLPAPRWLLGALALWLALTPALAPPSRTHDWVTQLALALSGHATPYTRADLHREAR